MFSYLFNNSREYLVNTFLVKIPLFKNTVSSAFLFSTAKKSDNKPILRENQGEKFKSEAITPDKALRRNPEDIDNKSRMGSFFNLKQ